jgi:hypothetical protein
VTRGVAYGEEDGFLLFFGFGESFLSPGIPIDGIIGMLEKVGTLLEDKPIMVWPSVERERFGAGDTFVLLRFHPILLKGVMEVHKKYG